MKEQLNNIILQESRALEELIALLEEQSKYVLSNNVMEMEAIAPKIEGCNKRIAELEMSRRGLTNGVAMSKVVSDLKDEELEKNYRKIKFLIENAVVQKDFNLGQITQGLTFTNRMLNILNPDRAVKTYNSYGKIKK